MIIMGIDPSLTATGVVVVRVDPATAAIAELIHMEILDTAPAGKEAMKGVRKSSDDIARARIVSKGLDRLIDEYRPRIVCSELPAWGGKQARATFMFGIVYGIIAGIRVPLIEIAPLETKTAATGDKAASKGDMIAWAYGRFPDAPWKLSPGRNKLGIIHSSGKMLSEDNNDVADALGVVEAGLRTPAMQFALALQE